MYYLTDGHSANPYLVLFALICHDVDASQIDLIVCFWVNDCNGAMTGSGWIAECQLLKLSAVKAVAVLARL